MSPQSDRSLKDQVHKLLTPAIASWPEAVSTDKPTSKGGLQYYLRIFHYADSISWTLNSLALVASIGSGSMLPLMTIIFGSSTAQFNHFAVGASSSRGFDDQVHGYILWFIYLFLARLVLTYIATLSISIAAIRTTKAMRLAFLEHTLRQEPWYFDKQGNGAIASQVITNGNKINSGIAEKLSIFFQSVATFLGAFMVALAIQWKLTLITMSIIPAIFLFVAICVPLDAILESRILKIYSAAAVLAEEAFSNVKTVHAFWAREKIMKKYEHFLEVAHTEGKKKSLIYAVLFSTQYFCVYCGIALAYWQGYRMYRNGEIPDVGKVFTVVLSVLIAAASIATIAPPIQAFTNASSAAAELFEVLDKPSQLDPLSWDGKVLTAIRGQIEIKDLKFSYPSRKGAAVLKGLSLSIPADETTALVGVSGCGKSTIVGLLERWYEKDSGDITLDGDDITAYNTRWLRRQIGLVQQEPVLFHGTVFQNVVNGMSDIQLTLPEDERRQLVREACVASNAHGFIEQLQNGYSTELGEGAGTLSGGQRQRIAIARSIISNPKILLLDEATSALDPRSESLVQDALDKISVDRTTVVIAHKLSTVRNADNIAVISDGVVVEQGNHDTLLKLGGRYAKLVAAQDLGNPDGRGGGQQHSMPEITLRQASAKEGDGFTAEEGMQSEQGTMGYSLVRCVWIMLSEQRSLYLCFVFAFTACLAAGATFPGQAILYSCILTVFTLPPDEGQRQVNFNSLMFFIIALGNLMAYGTIGITCNIIGQQLTHCYRSEMLRNILKQDIEFFDRPENSSGALTANITSLPAALQDLISVNLLLMSIVIVNVVSSSVVALVYGWKLGLVMVFGGFPPLLFAGYGRIRAELSLDRRNSEWFSESASLASECVLAIKTVSSLTLEPLVLEKYSDLLGGIVKRSIRSLSWNLWLYALSQSLEFLIMPLGFWYGSQLVSRGEYTIAQFYVIFIGVLFAGQAAAQLFSYTATITKATSAANYILWLRSLQPVMLVDPAIQNRVPKDREGSIDFNSVDFHYSKRRKNVLSDLSLTIQLGQLAAFVGPSGCGKSTMISLLERFYDPSSGTITFGNEAIPSFSTRFYRRQISLVGQEPTLFQGSIRDNVAIGVDYAEDETPPTEHQIIEACKQANAWDFIQSLPEGLATRCGSRGLQFSGGQKQRIAIARALIRKPRLLLLDEATSALDTESERLVQAALEKAAEGRTTIAVAHRLSTIKNADVIFVFREGNIVEMGMHAELLGLGGEYSAMCEAQRLDMA